MKAAAPLMIPTLPDSDPAKAYSSLLCHLQQGQSDLKHQLFYSWEL